MTVQELIDKLKLCDPKLPVAIQMEFWNCPDECSGFQDDITGSVNDSISIHNTHICEFTEKLCVLIKKEL